MMSKQSSSSQAGPVIWSIGTWKACERATFKGRPFSVKIPGSSEVLMSHPSTRFTDATSNLGWFGALWAANAPIAARAMAGARPVYMVKPPIHTSYPILALLNGLRNPGSVGQRVWDRKRRYGIFPLPFRSRRGPRHQLHEHLAEPRHVHVHLHLHQRQIQSRLDAVGPRERIAIPSSPVHVDVHVQLPLPRNQRRIDPRRRGQFIPQIAAVGVRVLGTILPRGCLRLRDLVEHL